MQKINFSTTINADRKKVWKALWEKNNYEKWTSVFAEGSQAVTDDWKEGSKVLFLDGKGMGMVSTVETNKPNEYMSFKHLGVVKDGVESVDDKSTGGWSGAHENYTLRENNGKTELTVEMDVTEDFRGYFERTLPEALKKVKEISEN